MQPDAQHPRHAVMIITLMIITLLGSLPGLSGMQAIDRDEARYAQASVQMHESGDYVNIRFHDRERHKKPAGIYWLGVYWAGLSLYDRRSAFIAAILLSTSLLFIFESHIAKTDAAICAAAVWAMGAVLRLRQEKYRPLHPRYSLILWTALGLAVIIKGPILPAILAVSILTTALWDWRSKEPLTWLARLISPLGICIFGMMTLPWFIMIGKETGGSFYGAAIGGDLAPKLKGGQENHSGYPGYYALTIFASFWPAALLLLAALSYGIRAAKGQINGLISTPNARWLISWIIPFWIILECVPTKLPHYILPLFPAMALLMAGAISLIEQNAIGGVIFFAITVALIFVVAGADALYGANKIWVYALGILIALIALITATFTIRGQMRPAIIGLVLTGLGLSTPTYGLIMPNLTDLRLAPRLVTQLESMDIKLPRNGGPLIRSPHFTEPSLIYYLGANILLGDNADDFETYPHIAGQIWLIDMKREDGAARLNALQDIAAYNQLCLKGDTDITGTNYSKGDEVALRLLSITACE